MEKLGSDTGCQELGLPALGSFLWSDQAMPDLVGSVVSAQGSVLSSLSTGEVIKAVALHLSTEH